MLIKQGLSAVLCAALVAIAPLAHAADDLATHQKAFDEALADAKALAMTDPARASVKIQALAALANRAPDPRTKAMEGASAQWLQAELFRRTSRADKALPILDAAMSAIEAYPKAKLHGDLLRSRGNLRLETGKIQLALPDLQKAHDIYRDVGEPRGQSMALMDLGSIYQSARDYPRVLQYYNHAEEIYKSDPNLALSLQNNRAMTYKAMGDNVQALKYFTAAREMASRLDSQYLELIIIENIAVTHIELNNYIESEKIAESGLRLARGPVLEAERPFLLGILAESRFRRGDVVQSAALMDKAFAGQNIEKTAPIFADLHKYAVEIYSAVGRDHLALRHLRADKRLDDEARALAADANAALMAARFDFANQDLKIANLKAGQLQADIKLARFRAAIAMVLLGGLIVIAGLLVAGLVSIRRSRDQVRAANVNLSAVNASLEKALKVNSEFLATTSHEVRTPLNGILGMTQVILADQRIDGPMREKVSIIHSSAEIMRSLVDDILDTAKLKSGHLNLVKEETDLSRILDEAALMWGEKAAEKQLGLRLDAAGAPKLIFADGQRLRQIVSNLLSNAIKFTDSGEVGLTAKVVEKDGIEHLAISVSDTGMGIAADQFEDVFVSFKQLDSGTTRQHGGTGLGLSICLNLARAMGGDITIESAVGQGSVFTVVLPLTRVVGSAIDEAVGDLDPGESRALAESSILLVEANPLAQSMIKAALGPHVQSIEIVGSGTLALSTLALRHFDRIVVEGSACQLPDASSLDSVRQLIDAAGQSPVSLLWSQPTEEETAALMALGAAQVLAKPMSPQAIVERLRTLCQTRPNGSETQPELKSMLTI